jgi:hypothetical protein
LRRISEYFNVTDSNTINAIHSYLISRSHPDDRALIWGEEVALPPVSMIAAAMRETNSEKTRDENSSVIWTTTLSLFSAIDAMQHQHIEVGLDWALPEKDVAHLYGAEQIAAGFDKELLRIRYIHPVIFLKGNLWKLSNGDLSNIDSVRFTLGTVNFERRYVDIVSVDASEKYIASMTTHFEAEIKKSLSRLARRLNKLEWAAAEGRSSLRYALSVS